MHQDKHGEIFQELTLCVTLALPWHHSLASPNFQLLGEASALDFFFFRSDFQMKTHQVFWYGEGGKAQSGLRGVKKVSGPNLSQETFATCATSMLLHDNRRAPFQNRP